MASKARIPVAHRAHAAPEDILPKLSQAEANRRAEAVADLHNSADGIGEKEIADATRDIAERMRTAMPYREYQAQVKRRKATMDSLPQSEERLTLQLGHHAGLSKLAQDNPYPADIGKVLDDAEVPAAKSVKAAPSRRVFKSGMVAKSPFPGWCPWPSCGQELLDIDEQRSHSDRHSRADARLAKTTRAAIVLKARQKARADLDARVAQLRQEIEDFKRERGMIK